VAHVEHAIHLRQVPPQASCQFGLPDLPRPHRTIHRNLCFDQRRDRDVRTSWSRGRLGDVSTRPDVRVDDGCEGVLCPPERVGFIVAEGVRLREVGEVHHHGVVVIPFELHPVVHARVPSLQPEVFLDAFHQAGAQFLAATVHRQDRHPSSQMHDQVPTVPALEGAALLLEPAPELLARHGPMIQQICCLTLTSSVCSRARLFDWHCPDAGRPFQPPCGSSALAAIGDSPPDLPCQQGMACSPERPPRRTPWLPDARFSKP